MPTADIRGKPETDATCMTSRLEPLACMPLCIHHLATACRNCLATLQEVLYNPCGLTATVTFAQLRPPADLQELLRHVQCDHAARAAHAGQVVAEHVGAHLEVVDNHGRQRRRGRKARAHHNQDVNLHHTCCTLLAPTMDATTNSTAFASKHTEASTTVHGSSPKHSLKQHHKRLKCLRVSQTCVKGLRPSKVGMTPLNLTPRRQYRFRKACPHPKCSLSTH